MLFGRACPHMRAASHSLCMLACKLQQGLRTAAAAAYKCESGSFVGWRRQCPQCAVLHTYKKCGRSQGPKARSVIICWSRQPSWLPEQ